MRTRPVGRNALLVLVSDAETAAAVRALVLEVSGERALPTPDDVVPAARTVLLDGLPGPAAVAAWTSWLESEPEPRRAANPDGRQTVLDTRYDGADLEVVAAAWSCSQEAAVRRHQSVSFLVAFCGFAPGFAYCVPSEALPPVPRRSAPRERVEAGSVAMAAEYCGVYPREMPGGWQLVGHTSADLFDAGREEPALLVPGDHVRFRAVT